MLQNKHAIACIPGVNSHMKGAEMLVVSLRGAKFEFWSHSRCSGQSVIILSRKGLF